MDRFNQSLNSHLLCYDPVQKAKVPMAKLGNPRQAGAPNREPFKNVPGVRAQEDGTAELSFYAPDAKKVQVKYTVNNYVRSRPDDFKPGGRGADVKETVDLEKHDDGYWYCTIDPGPGYHDIFFSVDGVDVINFGSPYGYDGGIRNFIDLPDDPVYQLQDVPHGALTREIYYSSATGRMRPCWVYTPPGYKKGTDSYPVLYIQHGGGEDEVCWFQSGKLDMILDNLIASGDAVPMIVVANNGYAYKEIAPDEFQEQSIVDVICNDCVPFIDENYRTIADREHRAVAGLSMGGGHSRRVAFGRPDLFANAGFFSSGEGFPVKNTDYDFSELFATKESFNSVMKFVYVTCGDADPRIEYTPSDVQPFIDKGYNIEYRTYKGRHEWNVWRASARDFVKKLFK